MGTAIESNNNTLLHWLCHFVVHQKIIIRVPSLADRISQDRGAQPLHHSRLTVAWLWIATSPVFFLSLFLSASSFVLKDIYLFLSLLPWQNFKLISVITLFSKIKLLLILTSGCGEKFHQASAHRQIIAPVARFTWCCSELMEKSEMTWFWGHCMVCFKVTEPKMGFDLLWLNWLMM